VETLGLILRHFLDLPYAMFGHSMGAALAYETSRAILSAAAIEPRVLFVSGRRGPHVRSRTRDWHALPRDELIAKLKEFNGTPAEVFEHEDMLRLVLPMLRSDLKLAETYAPRPGPALSCPVLAFGGNEDPGVAAEDLEDWRTVSTGPFRSILFAGDHFFINSARTSVLQAMRRELAALGLHDM
jgi:medium-chain acyl-[acyl-carrier-protein] hydrolase